MKQALAIVHPAVQMVQTRPAFRTRQAFLVLLAAVFLTNLCFGQISATVVPRSGPPTTKAYVSGSGFAPNAEIYIYFDTTYVGLVFANSSGAFSKFPIEVPASATPGEHWVSADQASNDTGATTPFKVNANWPSFGFVPSGGRNNPYENVLNPSNVANLQMKWSYYTGNTGPTVSSPAIFNNVVYVGTLGNNGGTMYAINATTGNLLWRYPATYNIGGIDSSPTVAPCTAITCQAHEIVYFGAQDNNLYALNAATGSLVWSYATGGAVNSSPVVGGCIPATCALGSTHTVYFGSEDGNLYALRAEYGQLAWSAPLGNPTDSSPALAGNPYTNSVVYIGAGSAVEGFDPSGSLVFTGTACYTVESSPAVVNNTIYFGDDTGCESAYSPDGTLLWIAYSQNYANCIYGIFYCQITSSAVAESVDYFGDASGFAYASSSQSGNFAWTGGYGNSSSAPAVANGVVYFAFSGSPGGINALSASSGNILWASPFSGVTASPSVVNGMVYIQAQDGYLYAFGLPNAPAPPVRPELGALRRQ